MKARMFRWIAIGLIASIPAQGSGAEPPGIAATSPDQDLPAHITRLTRFGERADFSHDGQRVLFVEKTFGDIYEVEIQTRIPRLLTGFYPHNVCTRALYLASGDILLFGPAKLDPEYPADARMQCSLSVLGKNLNRPPTPHRKTGSRSA